MNESEKLIYNAITKALVQFSSECNYVVFTCPICNSEAFIEKPIDKLISGKCDKGCWTI